MNLFPLVLCAVAAAAAEVYYHESIGVPQAARIKLAEENAAKGERIVGGWDAWPGDFPYMGGLVITLSTGATSVCGSTLLTNTRLLTAAHCWWDGRYQARELTVVLGSTLLFSGGVRVPTRDVEMHTNWNPSNLGNDIAIIRIPFVNYTTEIQAVNLPSDVQQSGNSFADLWGIAIGFGRTSDNAVISPEQYLNQVNLLIISNAECQQTFGVTIVTPSRVCASGSSGGPCAGDSGGPLVSMIGDRHVLVGVTSFGSWNCYQALPSVFTRVTWFEPWIRLYL